MANIFDAARDVAAGVAQNLVCPIFNSTPINTASRIAAGINGSAALIRDALTSACGAPQPEPGAPSSGGCGTAQPYLVKQYRTFQGDSERLIDQRNINGPLAITTSAGDVGETLVTINSTSPGGGGGIFVTGTGNYGPGDSRQFRYTVETVSGGIVDPQCNLENQGGYQPLTPAQITDVDQFIEINNTYNFIGGTEPDGGGDCPDPCPELDLTPIISRLDPFIIGTAAALAEILLALNPFILATTASLIRINAIIDLIRFDTQYITGAVNSIELDTIDIRAKVTALKTKIDEIREITGDTLDGLGLNGTISFPGRDALPLRSVADFLLDLIERIGYDESESKLSLFNEEQGAASVESLLAILYTHEGVEIGLKDRLGDGTFDEPYITVAEALQDLREIPVQPVIVQGWEVVAPRVTSARLHYASKLLSKNQEVRIEIPNFDKTFVVETLPESLFDFVRGDTYHILEYEDGSNIQVWTTNDGAGMEFISTLSQLSLNEYSADRVKRRLGGKNKPLAKQGSTFYLHTLEILEPQDEGFKRTVLRVRREIP